MKLRRDLTRWLLCDPLAMSRMSSVAICFAFEDARADILTLARLLCEAGYPRRDTPEEGQTMLDFAKKVQELIPHRDAVEL